MPIKIKSLTAQLAPEFVKLRHHLHQHPELSHHEVETAALVAAQLREYGFDSVETDIGGYGVVGKLKGSKPGKTLGLWDDMDALPIFETNELPYKSSRPGIIHACAHDDRAAQPDPVLMTEAGELLYQSHRSYSDNLALGSPETDLIISLLQDQGPVRGLCGGRITGGGSGGTVVVLCEDTDDADSALQQVCNAYKRQTGNEQRLIIGSSPGAVEFGVRGILRG